MGPMWIWTLVGLLLAAVLVLLIVQLAKRR